MLPECPRHKHCAYTGNEPGLCNVCHASEAKCGEMHGQPPSYDPNSWGAGVVTNPRHPSLKLGQPFSPFTAAEMRKELSNA